MGNYSEQEIKAFAEKDLRITKLAILKELIARLDMEYVTEPEEMLFPLANKYVKYTYEQMKEEQPDNSTISWVHLAEGLGLPEPSHLTIKILDAVKAEYKQANREDLNASNLLQFLMKEFGGYPTKQAGVVTILRKYSQ